MGTVAGRNSLNWSNGTYFLMLILIWFCANILSQAVFIGKFGRPYGKELLTAEIGIIYWILICVELLIYSLAIYYLKLKFKDKKSILVV